MWALNTITRVLIRDVEGDETYREGGIKTEAENEVMDKQSRSASTQQKLKKRRVDSPLEPSQEVWSCQA